MSDGNRDWNNKNNNNNYVRPVLAYLVKNIIRTEPESLYQGEGSEHIFLSKKDCRQPRLLCVNGQLIPEGCPLPRIQTTMRGNWI